MRKAVSSSSVRGSVTLGLANRINKDTVVQKMCAAKCKQFPGPTKKGKKTKTDAKDVNVKE